MGMAAGAGVVRFPPPPDRKPCPTWPPHNVPDRPPGEGEEGAGGGEQPLSQPLRLPRRLPQGEAVEEGDELQRHVLPLCRRQPPWPPESAVRCF